MGAANLILSIFLGSALVALVNYLVGVDLSGYGMGQRVAHIVANQLQGAWVAVAVIAFKKGIS